MSRGRFVQLRDGRHPLLRELKRGPAAHHPHPLTRRRPLRLLADHLEPARQCRDPIPPQLEIVKQSPANGMQMRVVQAGNHPAPAGVDHARPLITPTHHYGLVTDREKPLTANRKRRRAIRSVTIKRGHLRAEHDHVCRSVVHLGLLARHDLTPSTVPRGTQTGKPGNVIVRSGLVNVAARLERALASQSAPDGNERARDRA